LYCGPRILSRKHSTERLVELDPFATLNGFWVERPIVSTVRSCKDFRRSLDMQRFTDNEIALLSEHTHVLLYIYEHPEATVRELAKAVDASERQTFRWLSDLQQAGYLTRAKRGRRNRYLLNADAPVEECSAKDLTLGDFLAALAPSTSPGRGASEAVQAHLRLIRSGATGRPR
jgi:DNA-binding transcriptional ArsR family regulator